MWNRGRAPAPPRERPLDTRGEDPGGTAGQATPGEGDGLMARVLERANLLAARARVQRHSGCPGMDDMTVDDLPGSLKAHGRDIRSALRVGTYQPHPVRRVEIPKPGGGGRKLGIPTVLDRRMQRALVQVRQPAWGGTFSDGSDGFRPGRSAHHAIAQAQQDLDAGDRGVVDLDRETFVARVHHDQLRRLVQARITDRRVWPRIDRYLKAGALTGDGFAATLEGTPQGGPRSPLRANLRRDGLEKALETRGPRVVRDADDRTIDVNSARAGARVLAGVTRYVKRQLQLVVNAAKRAVDRPWRRTLLGLRFTARQPNRRQVRATALKTFTQAIRRLTHRTRGVSLLGVGRDVRRDVTGGSADCGDADATSVVKARDAGMRRRRRGYLWKPGGRRRDRELVSRGVRRDLAWNTVKSAHGPWRLRRSPALTCA